MKSILSYILVFFLFTSVCFSQSLTVHITKAGTSNFTMSVNYNMYITSRSISHSGISWEWVGRPNSGTNFIQGMVIDKNGARGQATVTMNNNGNTKITIQYKDVTFVFSGYKT